MMPFSLNQFGAQDQSIRNHHTTNSYYPPSNESVNPQQNMYRRAQCASTNFSPITDNNHSPNNYYYAPSIESVNTPQDMYRGAQSSSNNFNSSPNYYYAPSIESVNTPEVMYNGAQSSRNNLNPSPNNYYYAPSNESVNTPEVMYNSAQSSCNNLNPSPNNYYYAPSNESVNTPEVMNRSAQSSRNNLNPTRNFYFFPSNESTSTQDNMSNGSNFTPTPVDSLSKIYPESFPDQNTYDPYYDTNYYKPSVYSPSQAGHQESGIIPTEEVGATYPPVHSNYKHGLARTDFYNMDQINPQSFSQNNAQAVKSISSTPEPLRRHFSPMKMHSGSSQRPSNTIDKNEELVPDVPEVHRYGRITNEKHSGKIIDEEWESQIIGWNSKINDWDIYGTDPEPPAYSSLKMKQKLGRIRLMENNEKFQAAIALDYDLVRERNEKFQNEQINPIRIGFNPYVEKIFSDNPNPAAIGGSPQEFVVEDYRDPDIQNEFPNTKFPNIEDAFSRDPMISARFGDLLMNLNRRETTAFVTMKSVVYRMKKEGMLRFPKTQARKRRTNWTVSNQPRNECKVVISMDKSYCLPGIRDLDAMTDDLGQCFVELFEVGHLDYGKIVFEDVINVASTNLDFVVKFEHKKVVLYSNRFMVPRSGTEFNQPAIVTLYNYWPNEPAEKLLAQSGPETLQKYENCLYDECVKYGHKFVSFNKENGEFTFKITSWLNKDNFRQD